MATKFEKGDVVVLKSGGPPMTVDQVIGEQSSDFPFDTRKDYRCEWFKGATANHGSYGEHLLQVFVPPAKK